MCDHKRIKSVNCVLYCIDCGAQLPPEFNAPAPKQEDKPKKTKKRSESK